MKVLLLSYAVIPAFAKAFGNDKATNSAGWVVGIHNSLLEAGHQVALVSPDNSTDKIRVAVDGQTTCYAFPGTVKDAVQYNPAHPGIFKQILEEFAPDVVTILARNTPRGMQCCRPVGTWESWIIRSFIYRAWCLFLPSII